MKRYVIKHETLGEFDYFNATAMPVFVGRGAGQLYRLKLIARFVRGTFPRDIRNHCEIKKVGL